MKKRFLSWLLVLTMVFSLIPSTLVTALAAGDGVDIPQTIRGILLSTMSHPVMRHR